MGKEIRVGMYVLGGLLLLFCGLLYARLFGPNLNVPAMSITTPLDPNDVNHLSNEPRVQLQPTIVRPSSWDEMDEQPRTRDVEPISAVSEQWDAMIDRHSNPRRIVEEATIGSSPVDSELTNPAHPQIIADVGWRIRFSHRAVTAAQ